MLRRFITPSRIALAQALIAPMLLLALWLPGVNQGAWRVDTPLYTGIAKQMFAKGTFDAFWFPMASDYPYFNKPPLAFWIHGLFYQVLGTSFWAVRLPTLIGGMLTLEAARRAFGELGGRRIGLYSAVVLGLTVEFFRYTRAFSLDMWVLLWTMLAIWSATAAVKRGRPGLLAWGGISIGLALMTKPLFALAFPVIIAAWLVWIGRWKWIGWALVMALVGAAVAAPWHISMLSRWGELFSAEYFHRQTLDRAVGGGGTFERVPWWYFLKEFATTYWPWLLTSIAAGWTFAKHRRISHEPRLDRLAVLWAVVFAVALTAFSGKKIRYAVPMYPALSALSAAWLACWTPGKFRRSLDHVLMLGAPVALVVSVVLSALPIRWHDPSSGEMERLYAFVDQQPAGTVVWCTPDAVRGCAPMYLERGYWPKVVAMSPRLPGGYPKSGDIVLYYNREGPDPSPPREGDEKIGKFSGLFAVRLKRDWDAPYAEASGMIAARPNDPAAYACSSNSASSPAREALIAF